MIIYFADLLYLTSISCGFQGSSSSISNPQFTRHLMPGTLTRNSWISLIHLNVGQVSEQIQQILWSSRNITLAIIHSPHNEISTELLDLLNDITTNIVNLNNDLQNLLHDIPRTRIKRSLCGTCGSILNLLFGVSTEEHAQKVEEKLQEYRNETTQTITIVKEQLTLVDENTKRSIFNTQKIKNLQEVLKQLNEYNDKIIKGTIQKTLYDLQKTVKSIDVLSVIVMIQEDLSKLRTAVIASRNNDIRRSLVPDSIFALILKEIIIAAPKFALLNANQIDEARRISDIRISRDEEMLRIWIYTPLNELQEKVDFYETNFFPVPTSKPKVFAKIADSTKYFAVTKSGSLYQQIQPETFKRCKSINKKELLCASSNSYKKQPTEICPWLIMNELEDTKRACKINYLTKFDHKVKKIAEGRYIYSVPEATTIDIRCPQVQQNKRVTLEGMGVFQLEASCSAAGKSIFLPATFMQNETKIYNIPSKFNVSKINQRIPDLDIFKLQQFDINFNESQLLQHPTEANILKHKLEEIQHRSHPLTKIHENKGLVTILAIIIAAIIGKLAWNYTSKRNPRRASQDIVQYAA